MSIISILDIIFGKINLKNKSEQDFFKEFFDLLPSIRGRFNFCNFERYSKQTADGLAKKYENLKEYSRICEN